MPQANGAVAIATLPADLAARDPFHQHHFVGGNTYLLTLLRDNMEALEVSASTEALDASIARSKAHAQRSAATVELTDSARLQSILALTVEVSNLTGHKFPTGFPLAPRLAAPDGHRRRGRDCVRVGRLGRGGAHYWGRRGRRCGRLRASCRPRGPARRGSPIYESIMQNTEEEVTYTLLRAASYVKDNRLLPAGFDKETAGEDIAVVGGALTDTDFLAGGDTVGYVIGVPAAGAPLHGLGGVALPGRLLPVHAGYADRRG